MKKQLLVIAALLMTASTASAQQKAGTFSVTPKVGVTVSNFTGRMPVYVAYAVMPQVPEHGNHPKYADLLIAKKLASVYSRVFL